MRKAILSLSLLLLAAQAAEKPAQRPGDVESRLRELRRDLTRREQTRNVCSIPLREVRINKNAFIRNVLPEGAPNPRMRGVQVPAPPCDDNERPETAPSSW